MHDLYEDRFNIFPHLSGVKGRPLASVAFHPAENVLKDSMLEEAMRTYVQKGIGEKFKLSLLEFLNLPMDYVGLLLQISDEKGTEAAAELEALKKQLELASKGQ